MKAASKEKDLDDVAVLKQEVYQNLKGQDTLGEEHDEDDSKQTPQSNIRFPCKRFRYE